MVFFIIIFIIKIIFQKTIFKNFKKIYNKINKKNYSFINY